jgi:sugar lactone lactonase YvrE
MRAYKNYWLTGIAVILGCAQAGIAMAGASSGIETARQAPVVLLNKPTAPKLAVDRLGNLYFVDQTKATLQVFDAIDRKVSTLFTAQGAITDFAIDANNNVWIAIFSGMSGGIVKLSPKSGEYRVTRLSPSQSIKVEGLSLPTAVAVDGEGDLYIADGRRKAVLKTHPDGGLPTVVAANLVDPHRVAVDATGTLYVQDQGLHFVLRYRRGTALAFFPSEGGSDMTIDSSGNLYFAEKAGVRILDGDGKLRARLPLCPSGATAVAISPEGRLYALGTGGIFELPVANTSIYDLGDTILGRESQGDLAVCAQLSAPRDIAEALTLSMAGANASEFSQTSHILGVSSETSCSGRVLPAKSTCLLTIHFSPIVTGSRSAILSIKSNGSELLIPLSGTGVL